jgi:hypothetical protein
MQLIYLVIILAVIISFFGFVMMVPQEPIDYQSEARQLITQFTKSGEYIGFDVDPNPPVTQYTYKQKELLRTVTLANGTQINQTETVYEQVETPQTSISIGIQDRNLQQPKICKLGYQCDITGMINLIDPLTEKKIPPPYPYSDGTFRYTWIPTEKIGIGEFRATIYVTSKYTNQDNENERRIAVRTIQVVR